MNDALQFREDITRELGRGRAAMREAEALRGIVAILLERGDGEAEITQEDMADARENLNLTLAGDAGGALAISVKRDNRIIAP